MKRVLIIGAAVIIAPIAGFFLLSGILYLKNHSLTDELGYLERFSSPSQYFTATEAYDAALPAVRYWHADAVITGLDGSAREEPADLRLQTDGRLAWWTLGACSDSAGKWVHIVLMKGSISVGVTEKPWGRTTEPCRELDLTGLIGSDLAIQRAIALVPSSTVRWIRLSSVDPWTRNTLPLSWAVELDTPDGDFLEAWVDASTAHILVAYLGGGKPFPIPTP